MTDSSYRLAELEKTITAYDIHRMRTATRAYADDKAAKDPAFFRDKDQFNRYVKLNLPGGQRVTDAAQLAIVEQLRREAATSKSLGAKVPTDVFVFWPGEAESRSVTKIGGLPHWPANRPWPRHADGHPLGFIAQISFVDSLDIVGDLPGDILVIFGLLEMFIDDFRLDDPKYYWRNWNDPDQFRFEWVRLNELPLVQACGHPLNASTLSPYWGQRWRTDDFPDAGDAFSQYNDKSELEIIHGTKIGGVSPWIQWDPHLPGRFLCCLWSFSPYFDFLDRAPPLFDISAQDGNGGGIFFDDAGAMFVTIDDEGECHATVQSH